MQSVACLLACLHGGEPDRRAEFLLRLVSLAPFDPLIVVFFFSSVFSH